MKSARGWWYDGKTSARREVVLRLGDDGSLSVHGNGVDVSTAAGNVRVDEPLGAARRMIRFPGGETVETGDNSFLGDLQRVQGKGVFFRTVHHWENSLLLVSCTLVTMLVAGVLFFRFAVPAIAGRVASALPPATEELMGQETLRVLDRIVLKPSKLAEVRRRELGTLFGRMAAEYPERRNWTLEFRSGDAIGANAFALPSGIVIVTDRLVEISGSTDEIAAVLAHEIAHVTHRHALRHLLQNSATALIVATVTGDIATVTTLAATMPTVIIDAKYSRDFEREADDAAVTYLRRSGKPVHIYADILLRLEKDHGRGENPKRSKDFGEWFSDHPQTAERVKRILGEANGTNPRTR